MVQPVWLLQNSEVRWRDGARWTQVRAARHLRAAQEGKPPFFGPKLSHYPAQWNGELPFPFCALCTNLELLQKRSLGGKTTKKRSYFRHVSWVVCFWCFQQKSMPPSKAALAAASCFPGWQGHLVGRATCAGEAGETLSLDFPPRAIFHFLSHACAYLTLMFPIGLCPNLLQGIAMVMWEGDLNGVT